MSTRRRGRDFESNYLAMRRRMQSLGTVVLPAPVTIGPHTHSADQITFEPYGLLAADDVQEALEEHDDEKLARSGVQPMLGALDMNHYDINNVEDVEVEATIQMTGGVGSAIINGVRNIVMAGIGLIEQIRKADFTGSIVGQGVIDKPRVIHMDGDDTDNEARIDGLERVVFNDEPTKSVIENPSTIEFNPAVTPGTDTAFLEGTLSWSDLERIALADTGFGNDYDVRVALGWVQMLWEAGDTGNLEPLRVYVSRQATGMGSHPLCKRYALDNGNWDVEEPGDLPSFAVTTHEVLSHEGLVWVMQRGKLRNYDTALITGSIFGGELLWATGQNGEIGTTKPTYQNAPHVRVGRVMAVNAGLCDIEIDVQVLPLVHALPGHSWRRHFLMMGA